MKYLFERGADAKLKDNTGTLCTTHDLCCDIAPGQTCLHWAAASGDVDIVKYLVDSKKCSANIADNDGDTPLKVTTWKVYMCDLLCRLHLARRVLRI